jgi:hypothetical protein
VIAALALSVAAAPAAAKSGAKRIKLTGVVVGFSASSSGGGNATCPKVSLFQGKRKVGSWKFISCGGAGLRISYFSPGGRMQVGNIRGRCSVSIKFQSTGSIERPGPATHGTGAVQAYSAPVTENFYVKGPKIPTTLHARFSVTLMTKLLRY